MTNRLSKFTAIIQRLFNTAITATIAVAVLMPVTSQAQESGATLDEVVVTASRRGEADIMTTPLAMTALDGEEIELFPVRDLNDVAVSIPGLSSGSVSGFNSSQFAMRGTTETSIILYKESPVGVTMDDFVVPVLQTSNLEMFDIESVEVLRGPQGTLFGKNTTGGVINVRTKQPVLEENSGEARVEFGDFGRRKANLALNFGSEKLAFRFAGMYLNSDGYYKNGGVYGPIGSPLPMNSGHDGESGVGDGRDLGGDNVFSSRAKLLWSPNDDVNLTLQYELIRDKGDTPPIVSTSVNGVYFATLWGLPGVESGDPLDQAGNTQRNEFLLNMTKGHRVDVDGIYLNGDYAINDDYTLYFNLGNREQSSRLPSSYGGNPGPVSLFDATRDDDRDTSQAEVRIASNTGNPLNFVVGAYYQEDDTDFCVLQVVGMLDGFQEFFGAGLPAGLFNNLPLLLCNTQRAEAKAVYADGTWEVNDRFRITAGIRYSDEEKAWAGRPRGPTLEGQPVLNMINDPIQGSDFNSFPTGVQTSSDSWSEPTYRLILDYDLTEDVFGFFGYSRGFKSGGYNDQTGTILNPIPDAGLAPVVPEIADSFEGGIKTTFADGRGTLSANAYYVEYTDAQRTLNATFPTGQETLFFNAAEMTVKGVDIEGAFAATESLTLTYNLAYMDAEYDKFEADTDFDGIIDTVLTGNPVTRAPEFMGSVAGTWVRPLNNGGNLEVNFRYSYEDESVSSYSDLGSEFNTILESKSLLDFSLGYRAPDDKFYARLIGSNLTDDRYKTGSLDVAGVWVMSTYGPPRYWGVQLGTKF
jgi:iron complex outermembrane receptor protein